MTGPRFNARGQALGLWGHPLVEYPLFCSTTRVRVTGPWALLRAWRYFRGVSRDARTISGLRRMAFLVEGPRTFVILSVWDGEEGMLEFATQVDMHHVAVRMCFANAARTDGHLEIWSAQWKMWSASNNLSWDGHDDFAEVHLSSANGHVGEPVASAGEATP